MKPIRNPKWRWLPLLAALTIGAALLSGCGAKAAAGKDETLKLKIADITSNPVFRVAADKGIFQKHGIEAELITFATPAEGVNALFIKQVDVAFGADFPLLNAVSKGEYSIIASTGTGTDESAKEWKLFVRNGIQKPEDLKGKKLSFSRGTFIPYLWDVYLGDHGVALKDVELIGQGGFDEAFVALKKGEIDGAWVYGAVLNGKFAGIQDAHVLTDMSQTKVRIGTGIIVPDSLVREHSHALTRFLQALDEASKYAQEHPDETADLLFKEVKRPKEATLKDLPNNRWEIGFSQKAYDSLAGQKKYMVDNKIIEKDFNLADKIDLDLVRKVFSDRVIEDPK